jgi:hypothetical protein
MVIFDPAKNQANIVKHGLSLAEAEDFDFSGAVILIDDRVDYGETRYRAFSRADGAGFCLVFVVVDDQTIRAISYRRAHDKEIKRHGL